jgi:tetratricopeptide (TPR) repeat protein
MSGPAPIALQQAVGRLLHDAEQAWGRQDYQKSIALIEQASRLQPANPIIVLELAKAYGMRYDYAAAERHIERAIRISPHRAETLAQAAQRCLEFEHIDMAIRYLEQASREKVGSVGVLMTLSDMYIRDGRLDEAADLVARAARMDRNDPRVGLQEAVLRRARGLSDEAESLLRPLVATAASGLPVRIRGLYELAGILDRSGRYDEAMAALLEVKAIQRPFAAPYLATAQLIQNRAKEMERTITAAVLDRWRAEAAALSHPRRIALLCGHPRSGTTLLEQVLDAHPDIVSAEETKMMHDEAYLPLVRDFPEGTSILEALDSAPPSVLRHARENYFRCTERFTRRPIGSRLLVDKNPALNMLIPMVVRVFPEARFIVALRDPRDVVLSCFMQALPLTPVSCAYLSLESTAKQYASAMGFWLDMRPRLGDGWMHVRYESLVDDLPGVARSTLAFLGVDFDETVLTFYDHARTKRVNSPSHADVLKPVYRSAVGRWRNYQKYLEPYMAGLERFMKAFEYD